MIKPKTEKPCRTCGAVFKPFKTTDKFCSLDCMKKDQKSGKSNKINQKQPIPKISKKRKKETAIYLKKRIEFLNLPENKKCAVFPELPSTEIHHKKGRVGDLYLNEKYWLAVSREGHIKIELNPDWAKENGFSLSRLKREEE